MHQLKRPSLEGCWAKIARAREHNYSLEQLAEGFLKRRPNQVSFDGYSEPDWVIVQAVVEPIPPEFSTIAGDLIHNLRSALDLLIWQVVLTEGGEPGRHTAYPIMRTHADFERRVRNPPKSRKSPLEGINPGSDKWTLIERTQPYQPGGHDELLGIASFSNRDKHQGLLAGVSFTESIDPDELVEVVGDPNPMVRVTFDAPGVLEHDTEILRVRKTRGRVKMKADPPFEITVSDGESAWSIQGLDRMRSEVVEIVRSFERFF